MIINWILRTLPQQFVRSLIPHVRWHVLSLCLAFSLGLTLSVVWPSPVMAKAVITERPALNPEALAQLWALELPSYDGRVIALANLKGEKPLVLNFWATWCGPCLMQAPILEQLSEELSEDELKIVKIDVDENPNTAQQFGIMSIPTLLFKKNGEVVKQVAGVHTKDQLKSIVAELS